LSRNALVVMETQLLRRRFIMYVQPLDGSLTPNSLASPLSGATADGRLFGGGGALSAGDNISRFVPPWSNEGNEGSYGDGSLNAGSMQSVFGSLMGVLQQLMGMLQSLMGYGCNDGSSPPYANGSCPPYGNEGCRQYGNERFFKNANGSSEGDPHLSFNGEKWNNMASQPDLLNSNSFAGGFRISTQASPPNAKGVTWNQSATVTLDNGATTVSMRNNGEASVTMDGRSVGIARGQTLRLGDGESVTYEQNGSLVVNAQNGSGGRIETTLSPEGKGVNVDVSAHDVDLGGALVNGYERREDHEHQPVPSPGPIGVPGPIPVPVPSPISGPSPTPVPPFPVPVPAGGWAEPDY
jgi:hypothetical protein